MKQIKLQPKLKRNQTDFINKLGIGAFAIISITEFCGLLEYLFRYVLIIIKTEPKIVVWLSEIISLLIFSIIVVWGINKYNKTNEIDSGKTLNSLIIIFFGILITQFLFTYFGAEILIKKYSSEFEFYSNANKGGLMLQGYLAFIPILQYVVLGIILLMKRKTVANTVHN